jgi:hypothetical protein
MCAGVRGHGSRYGREVERLLDAISNVGRVRWLGWPV